MRIYFNYVIQVKYQHTWVANLNSDDEGWRCSHGWPTLGGDERRSSTTQRTKLNDEIICTACCTEWLNTDNCTSYRESVATVVSRSRTVQVRVTLSPRKPPRGTTNHLFIISRPIYYLCIAYLKQVTVFEADWNPTKLVC